MKLSILSDEISRDLDEALSLGAAWGIDTYELRSVPAGRVPRVPDPAEAVEYVRQQLARHGARLSAMSPGFYKAPADRGQAELPAERRALVEDSFRFAEALGVRRVICFTPLCPAGSEDAAAPQAVIDLMSETAHAAEREGFTLALENEHSCWGDTGARTAAIVRAVGSAALRVNWDPGNAHHAGERPFPDGWQAVRDLVENVHIKDSRRGPDGKMEWAIPGEGEIDWPGQLRALHQAGYQGQLTIETHLRPGPEQTQRSLEAVRAMLAAL